MTDTYHPRPVDQTERRLDELEGRVHHIESVVLAAIAVVSATCLALGLLLPYMTFRQDKEDITASAFTFALKALTYRDSDGDLDAVSLVFGIAFGGLIVVVLIAFGVLTMIARRRADRRSLWLVNTVAVLVVIGVLGVWLTPLLGSRSSNFALHQGPVWLSAGAVLFTVLAGSAALRRWWLRDA